MKYSMGRRLATIEAPLGRFAKVFATAQNTGMHNPDAMVVATVDNQRRPWTRAVLLKQFDESGFVFFTNLSSRKGRQLTENQKVSLHFYWRELGKQVIIQGVASLVSGEEADAYFCTRDRGSQLGAWVSKQSEPLTSRAKLIIDAARMELKFMGRTVPRPPHWSGFRVAPDYFEFWTAGTFRLHDRLVFEKTAQGWEEYRLYP